VEVLQAVDGLAVSWAPADGADSYEYRVAALEAPGNDARNVPASGSKVDVKGLKPGTRYYVQVRAVDKADNTSAWTTPRSAVPTAGDDLVDPTAPTTVAVADRTDTTLTLEWSGATDNDKVIGYYVYVDGSRQTEEPIEVTGYKVTGLEAKREYLVAVVAVDAAFNESKRESTKLSTAGSADTNTGAGADG
jgi:chitinase